MIPFAKVGRGELRCGHCGGEHQHHIRVDVFDPAKEDADHGLHVRIEQNRVMVDESMVGNPSLRRDGLAIVFACELCEELTTLSISQHKGATEWELRAVPKEGR